MNCKVVNFKRKKWPKFAKFLHGSVMRRQRVVPEHNQAYYYRDAGAWGVWVECIEGKIIVAEMSAENLVGDQLVEATEQEYRNDNRGYL